MDTYIHWYPVCVCVCVLAFAEKPEEADEAPTAMTLPSQARFNEHNIRVLKVLELRLVMQTVIITVTTQLSCCESVS